MVKLSKRFVRKFGTRPIYGAPHWATHLLLVRWKRIDMRATLERKVRAGRQECLVPLTFITNI